MGCTTQKMKNPELSFHLIAKEFTWSRSMECFSYNGYWIP